ncbi:DUF124 domain-containing protein [Pseudonocardia sp. Ae168_Ps1]|uniref:hypothetical protein n=1 Tax=unclassified Pseudonocardia TaxID=2619320 RepID=UPI00094B2052|nr:MULTISPECIES: hypothetical protein [unclassified Pseudonocardia]OLL70859.1 DUF124 domain-containing protein [Pseudonocardia sp. Ae168_Ps1]OLL88299.1 DUF124 domain-containing protein [Pseudonocardia sp. Ae263_Ps1]OLL91676.1 DUF124 domain-containing protein [Pseudonocardia sp. Ae356_Ps1]
MRTERSTGYLPARIVAAGLTGLAAVVLVGCATTVAGTPWPAGQGPARPAGVAAPVPGPTATRVPPSSFTEPASPVTGEPAPAPVPEPAPQTPPPAPVTGATRVVPPVAVGGDGETGGRRPGRGAPVPRPATAPPALTSDVLADECLLDEVALTGLLGTGPAVDAADSEVRRSDGTTTRSCFAVGGSSSVAVNVYTTNRTTPARYVRDAAGARPLTGTGDGTQAALLGTVAGPTLQLGTARHLVTIAVAGRTPSDEQWRAAARSAAAALPR